MHPDKWASRPDVQYHGGDFHNFGGDERDNPSAHFGTRQAAGEIAKHRAFHFGNDQFVYQRRIHNMDPAGWNHSLSDWEANTADMAHHTAKGGVPSDSLLESGDYDIAQDIGYGDAGAKDFGYTEHTDDPIPLVGVKRGFDQLQAGGSVAYRNAHEDEGSISHVVPHGAHSSYLQDVRSSPNRSQSVKDWASGPGRTADDPRPNSEPPADTSVSFTSMLHEQWKAAPSEADARPIRSQWNSWVAAGAWK